MWHIDFPYIVILYGCYNYHHDSYVCITERSYGMYDVLFTPIIVSLDEKSGIIAFYRYA